VSALDNLTRSQTDMVKTGMDPTLNTQTKWTRMGAAFKAAADDAESALDGLTAQLDAAEKALNRLLLPQKPAGASDVAIEGCAARLERLLPKNGADVLRVAPALLQELLDEGNALSAWVLCGGPGSPLGLNNRAFASDSSAFSLLAFNTAMSQAAAKASKRVDVPDGAAALLGLVSGGGSGTVRGIIDTTRWALADWRKQMSSYAASLDPNRYGSLPR
jgi:hypothetical protein